MVDLDYQILPLSEMVRLEFKHSLSSHIDLFSDSAMASEAQSDPSVRNVVMME